MKNLYTICFCTLNIVFATLTMYVGNQSDIQVSGLRFNQELKSTQFVMYNPIANTSLVLHDFGYSTILVGSSTLNPLNGIYYFSHSQDSKNYTLVGVNSKTGDVVSQVSTNDLAIRETEYDFKTGTLYGLRPKKIEDDSNLVSPGYVVEFVRVNPAIAQTDVIKTINEFDQIVVNTSCYNSNTGVFIVAAKNTKVSLSDIRLYFIDAQTGNILHRTNPLQYQLNAIQYNNRTNSFIGFATTSTNSMQIASVDSNGVFTMLSDETFAAIYETHIAFDQMNSLLTARVVNSELYKPYTIVFNVETKEFVSNVPVDVTAETVHEWEINNQEFASMFYKTSSVEVEDNQEVEIYPNPTYSVGCTIKGIGNFVRADVYTVNGNLIHTFTTPELELPASISSGMYTIMIHRAVGDVILKQFVVVR